MSHVAWSVSCLSMSAGHMGELCKNGWIDRDAVWGGWLICGSRELYALGKGADRPTGRGTFEGTCACSDHDVLTHSVLCLPRARGGRMHLPPRRPVAWQRCGLLANYFGVGHVLIVAKHNSHMTAEKLPVQYCSKYFRSSIFHYSYFVTGPSNGPVLLRSLVSVVVVVCRGL